MSFYRFRLSLPPSTPSPSTASQSPIELSPPPLYNPPPTTPSQTEPPTQPSAAIRWAAVSTPSTTIFRVQIPNPANLPPSDLGAPGRQSGHCFRLSGKKYFLTYSQVGDVEFSEVGMMFETMAHPPVQWAGVVEKHQDGQLHWHVICIFDKIPRVRPRMRHVPGSDSRIFDILDLHPNIRSLSFSQDVRKAWDYMHKDPLSERFGPWAGPVDDAAQDLASNKAVWSYIIAAETEADFRMRCAALDPKSYAIHWNPLCSFIEAHYEKRRRDYIPKFLHFPNLPEEMRDWVKNEMVKSDRPKSLVVWGPSRTGKTEWARSIGPHSYHNSLINGAEFDEDEADYIVLDDIDPALFPHYKTWLGAQKEFTLNEKYTRKRRVDWGKPAIWLSNSNPMDCPSWDRTWLEANTVTVHLEHQLYPPGTNYGEASAW